MIYYLEEEEKWLYEMAWKLQEVNCKDRFTCKFNQVTGKGDSVAKEKQHDLKKYKVSNPDYTPSLEDGWKGSCNLPSGWMAKEKQHNLKKDRVSNPDETPSLEDGWKGSCNLPSGWMSKEKQHDLKKDKVSHPDETPSREDGWKGSGDLPSCWMAKQEQHDLKRDFLFLEYSLCFFLLRFAKCSVKKG